MRLIPTISILLSMLFAACGSDPINPADDDTVMDDTECNAEPYLDCVVFTCTNGVEYTYCPPDQDTDNDSVNDSEDSCPEEQEDYDGVADGDGCPDTDEDGDGWSVPDDCNDEEYYTHPGAEEFCDHEDNDCDGQVDENNANCTEDQFCVMDPTWWVSTCALDFGTCDTRGDTWCADPAMDPYGYFACVRSSTGELHVLGSGCQSFGEDDNQVITTCAEDELDNVYCEIPE